MILKPWQADALLTVTAVSWGVTFLLVQEAVRDVPVGTFLLWRFGLAFLLMLMIAYRHLAGLDGATLTAAGVLGGLNFTAYALQTYGLTRTFSTSVAFVTGLFVVLVPLMAFFLFRRPVARPVWLGSGIALLGLWLLTTQGEMHAGWGEGLSLGCALFFALHILYTDRFVRRYDVPLLVAFQFGTMALGSAGMALVAGEPLVPAHFSSSFLIGLVTTVLFATVFAFWVQTSMQRYTTPGRAALIFTLEPLSAALFGYAYGGEVMGGLQMLGGGLIVMGVLVAELTGVETPPLRGATPPARRWRSYRR